MMLRSNLIDPRLKNDSFIVKIDKEYGNNRDKIVHFVQLLVTFWDQVFLRYFEGAELESE